MSLRRLKQEIVEELKNEVYSIIEEALVEERRLSEVASDLDTYIADILSPYRWGPKSEKVLKAIEIYSKKNNLPLKRDPYLKLDIPKLSKWSDDHVVQLEKKINKILGF